MKALNNRRTAVAAAVSVLVASAVQTLGMSPASAATDVKLGVNPVQNATSVSQLAVEKGLFKKNGLNASLQVFPAPPQIVTALQANQVQFGYMPIVSALTARTNSGIDLKIVAASDGLTKNDSVRASKDRTFALIADPSGLCVSKDIKNAKQLEGKTVAVGQRGGFPELAISTIMRKAGADPKKVQWAVLGPSTVVGAIKNGTVAAAYTSSPYTGQCKAEGLTILASPAVSLLPQGGPITAWVTTAKFAKENPQVVAAFQKSIYQAAKLSHTKAGMDAAIVASTQFTKVPPADALKIPKSPWYFETLTRADVQNWANELQRSGLVVKPVDVPGIILPQPKG